MTGLSLWPRCNRRHVICAPPAADKQCIAPDTRASVAHSRPNFHWITGAEVIADLVIADAIRDRFEHAALAIRITGESYRGVKVRKLASKKKRRVTIVAFSSASDPPGSSALEFRRP